jgi:simple sugar transport system permease protein
MQYPFFRRYRFERLLDPLMPLFAALLALVIGALMMMLMKADPIEGYKGMWEGAFGTKNAAADTFIKATPLLLVGIGICISFRGGVVNIGGEGQMIAGGVAAVAIALNYENSNPNLVIPACLIASFLAGAFWGGLAGVLKAYFKVNEILSTIMLNQIATFLMMYLVRTVFLDPKQEGKAAPIPETKRLNRDLYLPRLGEKLDSFYQWSGLDSVGHQVQQWTPTKMNEGMIWALILAVVVYILLWRTTIGYRIRAVGKNPRASRYAGIHIKRYTVLSLLLSGGLAGLAGGIHLLGVRYQMNAEGGAIAFTGNAGFNGIVVALFGGLHPIGTIPAAILFGALLTGGNKLQRTVHVPSSMTTVLIGMVIVFVVSSQIFVRDRARRRVSASGPEPATEPSGATVTL